MALAANESPEGPHSTPTCKPEAAFLRLPTEMVQGVSENLDLKTLKALRLTCKELRDKSLHHFGTKHLHSLRLIVSLRSLQNLVAISKYFGKYVRYLSIVSQPYYDVHLRPYGEYDPKGDEEALGITPKILAFFRLLREQHSLRKDGSDIVLLVKAFHRFQNLGTIQLCYLFTDDRLQNPVFSTIDKTKSLQRHWKSEDFDPHALPEAHFITPIDNIDGGVYPTMTTLLWGYSDLSLYPIQDAVMEAIEKSDCLHVNIDVRVTFWNKYDDIQDTKIGKLIQKWSVEPFSLCSPNWKKIAKHHLRGLAIHGSDEEVHDFAPWVASLFENSSVVKRLEEIHYSNLTRLVHGRYFEPWTLDWQSLKHVTLDYAILAAKELKDFFSKVSATLEAINLHDVCLQHDTDS